MITRGLIVCVGVLALTSGWQTHRLYKSEKAALEYQVSQGRAYARAVDVAVEEGNRRVEAAQKELKDARKKLNELDLAAAASATAGERLRNELALARRRTGACNPAATDGGAAAEAAERVLADVQRRLDEAADGIAVYAGKAAAAGATCERLYDSLTVR